MPLRPKLRYTPTKKSLGICLHRTIRRMPGDRTPRSVDASFAILTRVLRFEASSTLRRQTDSPNRSGRFWLDSHVRSSASALWLSRITGWFSGEPPQTPRTWCSLHQSPLMTRLDLGFVPQPRNRPPTSSRCSCHHAARTWPRWEPSPSNKAYLSSPHLEASPQWPFALVLHLHQHKSSHNLHLQYLAKSQSTKHCQSLITPGSDHPPVLEPHMVLSRSNQNSKAWNLPGGTKQFHICG
jgi:hypothetical protein